MSIKNGLFDGYTYCGPRDYAISSRIPSNSGITLNVNLGFFEVYSAEPSDVNTVKVDVSASLL